MSTDAPIKINQMTRGDNRYYHLRSHRIHPQSMDMFESRISFALDNKEVIEKIDSDEEEPIDFDYEGVIYKRLPIDDMIVDRVTGRQMGYLIAGEMIDFIGPEEEQIHEKNKE